MQNKLKSDLKRLAGSPLVGGLSKQFNVYEDKVKKIVHDFDLKSREARKTSRKQIEKFTVQLKKTRSGVEKKVSALLNEEGKRLNKAVLEMFNYLKSMAKNEKLTQKGKSSSKKKSPKARRGESSTTKRAGKSRSSASSQSANA